MNGTQNNDKKIKCLVEPVGLLILYNVIPPEEREVYKICFSSTHLRRRRMFIGSAYYCFWFHTFSRALYITTELLNDSDTFLMDARQVC
jgi:hypothetical protein